MVHFLFFYEINYICLKNTTLKNLLCKVLVTELLKNYNRIVLMNNNDIEKIHRKYTKDMVALNSILTVLLIIFTVL
jgi:hypothetical protein